MLIRYRVHSGWSPFGMVSIRDYVHSGLCPFGIVSIQDRVQDPTLPNLPEKVYANCLERKCREIRKSKLENGKCGYRSDRSTADQIFTLKQIFGKSWEYEKDVFACFVDLEKAKEWAPRDKLWRVLQEYGIDGHLLMTIKSK